MPVEPGSVQQHRSPRVTTIVEPVTSPTGNGEKKTLFVLEDAPSFQNHHTHGNVEPAEKLQAVGWAAMTAQDSEFNQGRTKSFLGGGNMRATASFMRGRRENSIRKKKTLHNVRSYEAEKILAMTTDAAEVSDLPSELKAMSDESSEGIAAQPPTAPSTVEEVYARLIRKMQRVENYNDPTTASLPAQFNVFDELAVMTAQEADKAGQEQVNATAEIGRSKKKRYVPTLEEQDQMAAEDLLARQPCPLILRLVLKGVTEAISTRMEAAPISSIKDCLRLVFECRSLLDKVLKEAPMYQQFAELENGNADNATFIQGSAQRNEQMQALFREFQKCAVMLPSATYQIDEHSGRVMTMASTPSPAQPTRLSVQRDTLNFPEDLFQLVMSTTSPVPDAVPAGNTVTIAPAQGDFANSDSPNKHPLESISPLPTQKPVRAVNRTDDTPISLQKPQQSSLPIDSVSQFPVTRLPGMLHVEPPEPFQMSIGGSVPANMSEYVMPPTPSQYTAAAYNNSGKNSYIAQGNPIVESFLQSASSMPQTVQNSVVLPGGQLFKLPSTYGKSRRVLEQLEQQQQQKETHRDDRSGSNGVGGGGGTGYPLGSPRAVARLAAGSLAHLPSAVPTQESAAEMFQKTYSEHTHTGTTISAFSVKSSRAVKTTPSFFPSTAVENTQRGNQGTQTDETAATLATRKEVEEKEERNNRLACQLHEEKMERQLLEGKLQQATEADRVWKHEAVELLRKTVYHECCVLRSQLSFAQQREAILSAHVQSLQEVASIFCVFSDMDREAGVAASLSTPLLNKAKKLRTSGGTRGGRDGGQYQNSFTLPADVRAYALSLLQQIYPHVPQNAPTLDHQRHSCRSLPQLPGVNAAGASAGPFPRNRKQGRGNYGSSSRGGGNASTMDLHQDAEDGDGPNGVNRSQNSTRLTSMSMKRRGGGGVESSTVDLHSGLKRRESSLSVGAFGGNRVSNSTYLPSVNSGRSSRDGSQVLPLIQSAAPRQHSVEDASRELDRHQGQQRATGSVSSSLVSSSAAARGLLPAALQVDITGVSSLLDLVLLAVERDLVIVNGAGFGESCDGNYAEDESRQSILYGKGSISHKQGSPHTTSEGDVDNVNASNRLGLTRLETNAALSLELLRKEMQQKETAWRSERVELRGKMEHAVQRANTVIAALKDNQDEQKQKRLMAGRVQVLRNELNSLRRGVQRELTSFMSALAEAGAELGRRCTVEGASKVKFDRSVRKAKVLSELILGVRQVLQPMLSSVYARGQHDWLAKTRSYKDPFTFILQLTSGDPTGGENGSSDSESEQDGKSPGIARRGPKVNAAKRRFNVLLRDVQDEVLILTEFYKQLHRYVLNCNQIPVMPRPTTGKILKQLCGSLVVHRAARRDVFMRGTALAQASLLAFKQSDSGGGSGISVAPPSSRSTLGASPNDATDVLCSCYETEVQLCRQLARLQFRWAFITLRQQRVSHMSVATVVLAGYDPTTIPLPAARLVNSLANMLSEMMAEKANIRKKRFANAKAVHQLWQESGVDIWDSYPPLTIVDKLTPHVM